MKSKKTFILTIHDNGGMSIQEQDDSNEIVFDSGASATQEIIEELQDAGMLD